MPISTETSLQQHYRQRLLTSLYAKPDLELLVNVTACIFLYSLFATKAGIWDLLRWVQIMALVVALRHALIYAYRARSGARRSQKPWRIGAIGTLFASGLAWGSASVYLAPSGAVADQALIAIFICGFVSSHCATYGTDRLAFLAVAAPAICIPFVNLTLFGSMNSTALAGALMMFLVLLLAQSMRMSGAYESEVTAHYDNASITQRLEEEKSRLENLTADLERSAKARSEELARVNQQLSEEIADRREAERAVKVQESRFSEAFEQAPIGMLIVNASSGKILRANGAVCRALGYEESGLDGVLSYKLLCPSERTGTRKNCPFAADTILERRYIHRHGYIVWGRTSVARAASEAEHSKYIIVQIEDLSDLKRAREDLSERTDALQMAFDYAPSSIAVLDRSGRFVDANESMKSLLRIDTDVEGRSFNSILNPGDRGANPSVLGQLFSGELDSIEFEHRLFGTFPEGKLVTVRVTRIKSHQHSKNFAVVHIREADGDFANPAAAATAPRSHLVSIGAG